MADNAKNEAILKLIEKLTSLNSVNNVSTTDITTISKYVDGIIDHRHDDLKNKSIEENNKSIEEDNKKGGKTLTKYNIFMRAELDRLKKKNPNVDHKTRFKNAVNNWKKNNK